MITNVMIYKEDGIWVTEVRGSSLLLCTMSDSAILLCDGSAVGRWQWDTWEHARQFIFGPPYDRGRGFLVVRRRAWMISNRQRYEEMIDFFDHEGRAADRIRQHYGDRAAPLPDGVVAPTDEELTAADEEWSS